MRLTPPGGERVRAEILSRGPAGMMRALLDRDADALREGDPLPLGWHWFHFKRPVRASSFGADGHERRGAFMPDVDLPGRMWAGGTLRSPGTLRIGERAELRSRVTAVEEKRGRSGRLVFVTVGATVSQGGRARVEEERVIVYREGVSGSAAGSRAAERDATRDPGRTPPTLWRETFLPTAVTLFRFSALTHNAHRIHYDHRYATEVEGYPGLVVHGPLVALLLLDSAARHGARPVTRFRYRALAPLFVDRPVTLVGRAGGAPGDGGRAREERAERIVEALGPDGAVAMRGWVDGAT